MRHPYRIREIAVQAGLSEATVDRVLHRRGGVRESTVREVRRAIEDLDRQRDQVRLGGRTFLVDVVVRAPARFSAAIRAAMEAELPGLRPAIVRVRFHDGGDVVGTLARLGRTGSHGVVLKAPDTPEIVAATRALAVPLVTLVTDLPASPRIAYAGIDNHAAGATAAYLIEQWLGDRPGSVLVVRAHESFRGEDDRAAGFRAEIRRPVVESVDEATALRAAREQHPDIRAIYSLYAGAGGNTAVVEAFQGHPYGVFIAHDLDRENTMLLRERKLSAVLHHDLRTDLRRACHAVLQAHGALPGPVRTNPSAVQVITPHNAPPVEF
ncbi:LacI family DNA-binding transcriptional regulator [Paractinoplanes lichenicola]|uniref:LacI family DNA-binding transcriptional regulator n=1 Tax=Paractinoplanes lichenicola TaxID=2802976 RepID=A0ABS1VIY2_9ACTN|nr:LacI family DNA-binding transcriptional regulator [Actinoplanes lichenicola]MBL7254250.1 LacI family DNA-binding transcriptional regulator [Actinoplanes lichenicola]